MEGQLGVPKRQSLRFKSRPAYLKSTRQTILQRYWDHEITAIEAATLIKENPPAARTFLGGHLIWRERLGRRECPYMERWVLDLGRFGSIRLHHWFRSDDARARHDHPSDFITLVLKGSYMDLGYVPNPQCDCGGEPNCIRCNTLEMMRPGKIAHRKAEHRHTVSVEPPGCWTLLYFFPDRRTWGFWVPRKIDGKLKFVKSNKYFLEHGHHPCDQL